MNDVVPIQAVMPCVRGCSRPPESEDQPPLLLGARHGAFCDRCYWKARRALDLAADVVEHLIGLVSGIHSKESDGSQKTKKTPPLPMNVEAFNGANETYSRLVYWCSVFATRMNRQPPVPAARAWRTDGNRIVGLPADISPSQARYAVSVMAQWLAIHLDDICATVPSDDVAYFQDEISEDLFRLNAKWPREDQAQYAPVHCPDDDCKGRIAIYPPRQKGDDRRIVCEKCGRRFLADDYDHMASVFRQVRKEQAQELTRAARTAARLNQKYGKGQGR